MQLSFGHDWRHSVQQFLLWGRLQWSIRPFVIQFLLHVPVGEGHPLQTINHDLESDSPIILLERLQWEWFHRVLRM